MSLEFDEATQTFIEQPAVTTSRASLLNQTTNEVCLYCNSGWMSKLEEAAKPSFLRLAGAAEKNERIAIAHSASLNIARWAQKMAITNELRGGKNRVVTSAMGQQLRNGRTVQGSVVWIARHASNLELATRLVHLIIAGKPKVRPGDTSWHIALTSITFRYATLLVFITDKRGQLPPPVPADRWSLLWRFNGLYADYPPMHTVNLDQLTALLTKHTHWLPTVQVTGYTPAPKPPGKD